MTPEIWDGRAANAPDHAASEIVGIVTGGKDRRRMPSTHYVGKAGQFAVMAQLSLRGYNVAIPEIDIGDDVFVLNDRTGQLYRIQVKTARAKALLRTEGAYRCQFSINLAHVNNAGQLGSHYVLVASCGIEWRFLVFPRDVLSHLIHEGFGTPIPQGQQILTVVFFGPKEAKSSTRANAVDLSRYAGNWDAWAELI